MTGYILTTAAEADLRGIIRYTGREWGAAQVRRYMARLEQAIVALAAGQGSFKEMSDLFPGLRMVRCERHYIFCLPRENELSLIVAIFHERMDIMTRLTDRMSMDV
ncbi:type II toxin-antitoxin system RelE/ParE family toxin [Thalassospira mesophila]|uniref:Plasmid stabilization protein ParE n=1 Tax=Thalassospira mesophila TaxID=1293891 RepID=A0A1Y2KUN1_9PROT|nr:type II toxin-antitoxin system RelE/ParE family toxin [Thalassospira mesophila]OSQ35133.1 plasmid stabilization protein ParE [Thalassospira mesophila]